MNLNSIKQTKRNRQELFFDGIDSWSLVLLLKSTTTSLQPVFSKLQLQLQSPFTPDQPLTLIKNFLCSQHTYQFLLVVIYSYLWYATHRSLALGTFLSRTWTRASITKPCTIRSVPSGTSFPVRLLKEKTATRKATDLFTLIRKRQPKMLSGRWMECCWTIRKCKLISLLFSSINIISTVIVCWWVLF